MKRFIITFVLLISFFVFQGTVFVSLFGGKIVPNLVLILVMSLGMLRGKKSGLLIGFFAGLLFDIFCSSVIGFFAILFMYIGYLSGVFYKVFYPEDVKLPMAIIAVGDLIYGFMSYVFLYLLKGKLDIAYYFAHIAIPECVYTIAMTILIYPLIMLINRTLEREERMKDRKFV